MTDPTAGVANKVANSVLLQAISRLSMAGIIPVTLALGFLAWKYMQSRFELQTSQVSTVIRQVSDLDGSAQAATSKADRVATDLAVAQSVLQAQQNEQDRFRADTSSKLDQLSTSVATLSTTMAGLAANIADWRRQDQQAPGGRGP